MAFTPYSAKNAKVRYGVGGTTLAVKSWNVTPKSELIETTHSEAGGFRTSVPGISQCDITIETDDDSTTNLYSSGWYDGANITNLKLYLSGTSGPYWLFPTASIESPAQKAEVKSTVGNTFTLQGNGTFTYPSGTF